MAFWRVWESRGAEPWVVQVLREGYILPFHSPPPLSSTPIPLPSYSPSSIRGLALVAAVKDLLAKGAIEPASPGPGFYSCLFVTPKVTGGWRPVIDLSCLNSFIRLSHFCMETAQSVLQSIISGDWMISLDLQDAYLRVPVHPESRRYLRFCLGDQIYQFRVLCFGLSSAPQVFTRVMAPVSSIVHRFGFRFLRYLDDWLVLGSSLQEIIRARDFLLTLCSELGIHVNLPKSSLTPSQRQDYLGMTLQSSPLRAFPTQAQVQKVLPRRRILVLTRAAAQSLAIPPRGNVLSLHSHSGLAAPDAVAPASSSGVSPSGVSDHVSLLGRLLPVVVRSLPSRGRGGLGSSSSGAHALHRRVRRGVGRVSRLRPPIRLVVSRCLSLFDQPPRAFSCLPCHPRFSTSPPGQVSLSVHRQYVSSVLPPQGRGHALLNSQLRGSGHPSPLRGLRCSSAPPVCSGSPERLGRLSQSRWAGPRLGVDSPRGCVSRTFLPLASHGGFVRHLPQPSPSGVFFPNGGS